MLAELIRHPATNRLELAGLPYDDMCRQLEVIAGRSVSADLARRVYDLTGGNRFFVGELARNLGRPGIPLSIQAAIARRIDGLSVEGRDLLGVASIVGRDFSVAVLAATVGRPASACLDLLGEALAAGLIEPTGSHGSFRFVHALVRDAIEAAVPLNARRELHRASAVAIERLHTGWIEPHLSDLARHWAAAAMEGDSAVAASWAERAGDEAVRRLAFEEAVRLYDMALEVGASEIDDSHRYRLLLSLAKALHHTGEHGRTREASALAAAAARRLGRADLVAEAVLVMECLTTLTWDRALRECAEALAGLGPEPTGVRARVLGRLAETEVYVGDFGAAEESSGEALAVAEQCAEPDALVAALRARQLVRSGPDGVVEREELAGRLLQIGRDRGSPATEMSAHWWRLDAHFARGALADVAAELEELAWCTDLVGGPVARWFLLRYRGALAQARGGFAAAREYADAAFAAIEPTGIPRLCPCACHCWV